jgi:hypothetical protein
MTTLFGRSPKETFKELLKIDNTNAGADGTLRAVVDGLGAPTPLKLSNTAVSLNNLTWPSTGAGVGKILAVATGGTSLEWLSAPSLSAYDLVVNIQGKPAAAAQVMTFATPRAFTLPAGLVGSIAKSGIAAAASSVFSIRKNGTQVGTVTISASGTVGSFVMASQQSFVAGDVLSVIAPTTADANLANISITLVGTLV